MSKSVEFFFDVSSPWTCLAFHNIQPILEETGAQTTWRPFLVGGVFNAVNKSVYAGREDNDSPKMRFYLKSMLDWARWSGVTMNFPSAHHPVRSVHAMRIACALEDDQSALLRYAGAAFDAYFTNQQNIDDPEILRSICDAQGFDAADLLEQAQSDSVKAKLRANTQEVIDRGGFGSPTIFVDRSDMYFGNDQLPLVHRALQETR